MKEKNLPRVVCLSQRMEHPWHRCANGSDLVLLCVENLQQPAPAPAPAALSMTTGWQRKYLLGLSLLQPPGGADWSSWCRTHLWPNPLLKSRPTTQWKQRGKAGGRAAVAPHDQTQFLSHFNSPLPWQGCCLATLHPSSTSALQSCCSPAAPPVPQVWAEPCSHGLPAACKQRYHLFFNAWKQVGVRKMEMWRTLCITRSMETSALPDAFLVLALVRRVLAPNSSILVLFMWLLLLVSHWHPEQVIEISIWLRTRDNLLPT